MNPTFDPPDYPGMKLEPAERARIIGQFLGPMLAKRTAPPLILDWDHNWDKPESPLAVLADREAAPFIAGVAWHCYGGNVAAQTQVHAAYPDKDAYFTECSGGEWDPDWRQFAAVVHARAHHRLDARLVARHRALESGARRKPRPARRAAAETAVAW